MTLNHTGNVTCHPDSSVLSLLCLLLFNLKNHQIIHRNQTFKELKKNSTDHLPHNLPTIMCDVSL